MTRGLLVTAILGALLAVGADLVLGEARDDAGVWWSAYAGYWAAFGLVWCVVLVLVSKWLGRLWLQRREDYYPAEEDDG